MRAWLPMRSVYPNPEAVGAQPHGWAGLCDSSLGMGAMVRQEGTRCPGQAL
jgi:hypothetical protein